MAKIFDIEYQYQLYLKRVDLKEENMPEDQVRETKRAFYGAFGQLLRLLVDDMAELDELSYMLILESLEMQVKKFWSEQS